MNAEGSSFPPYALDSGATNLAGGSLRIVELFVQVIALRGHVVERR